MADLFLSFLLGEPLADLAGLGGALLLPERDLLFGEEGGDFLLGDEGGDRLLGEGDLLLGDGDLLRGEGDLLLGDGDLLRCEADLLRASCEGPFVAASSLSFSFS